MNHGVDAADELAENHQLGESPGRKVEHPSPLTGLANSWIVLLGIFYYTAKEFFQGDLDFERLTDFEWSTLYLGGALVLIALLSFLVGFLQSRTTSFVVDHEFRIERRLFSVEMKQIAFTKVQSVDITRPLAARLLGLSQINIDVGNGQEKLRFLRKTRAEELRDYLLDRMADGIDSEPENPGSEIAAGSTRPAQGVSIYHTELPDVLLGSVLSVGLFGAVLFVLSLVAAFTLSLGPWGALLGLTAPGAIVLGAAAKVGSGIIRNWDFGITQTDTGLRIQRGLFTRVQTTLRPDRVQTITIHQPFFFRLVGRMTVRISVLGQNIFQDESDGINILLPFGKKHEALQVLQLVLPGFDPFELPWTTQAPAGRRLTWFGTRQYHLGEELAATRWQLFNSTIQLVPYARLQGVGLAQGPLQRLAGVAQVDVYNIDEAPDVVIKHLEPADARQVFEQLHNASEHARAARSQDSGDHKQNQ